jgi:hypothetical protein
MVPELSLEQIGLLATIVTLVLAVLNIGWVAVLKQPKPKAATMKWIVAGGSLVLAFFWTPLALPAFPAYGGEPMTFAGALLVWAGSLLAAGTLILKVAQQVYDRLLSPILAWIDTAVVAPKLGIKGVKALAAWPGFLRPKAVKATRVT